MKKYPSVLIALVVWCSACGGGESQQQSAAATQAKEALQIQYPEIPRDEIVNDSDSLSTKVFTELQEKYKANLTKLNEAVKANGATLLVVFVTPEVGNSLTKINRVGKGIIADDCHALHIPFYDITTKMAAMPNPVVLTQMPKDGHWSKAGAKYVADELAPIIKQYDSVKSTATFQQKPETWGDLQPNADELTDGGKGLPYRMKSNAQGLRMDYDLAPNKIKQRILLLGDSEIYFPFLDNQFTGTALLQGMFPEKEILNAANWGYSVDDYLSLYNEKAKYTEADVVIVAANGNDILDMFFSHRNRFTRGKEAIKPSALEGQYYKTKFH